MSENRRKILAVLGLGTLMILILLVQRSGSRDRVFSQARQRNSDRADHATQALREQAKASGFLDLDKVQEILIPFGICASEIERRYEDGGSIPDCAK
ncbi:MAG TPA: hypothetical protein VL306_00470 [Methylomirabilota bacterium]|jgi:hypothetical protein|nr:hypothetical protein [Methylomirabilota bacterium]